MILAFLPHFASIMAEDDCIDYSVGITGYASTGEFAPYLVSSLNHGKLARANGMMLDAAIEKTVSAHGDFSWGFGLELITGTSSHNTYDKWDIASESWTTHDMSSPGIWLQQIYGEARYRSLQLTLGMKEHTSYMLNQELSSGDIVESGNARPMPELRLGFSDFVDVPLTNHWLQVDGSISYGPRTDDKFQRDLYNYYNYHIASGEIYSYKHLHLRSDPDKPFCVTVGMQMASLFGGKSLYFDEGRIVRELFFDKDFKSYLNMIMPVFKKKETFVQGSTLGSWDFAASYELQDKSEIRLYFQGPFEDGSGIARRNGADGIWGFEYASSQKKWLSGFVIEYIDFRNQSGPVHWEPDDTPGTNINVNATGRDDYYNNGFYNSYDNYGMSIGSPFLIAPIYNTDGYPAFACNRANGFHVGVCGSITDRIDYRITGSYQRGLGQYVYPYQSPRTCTSMMAEGRYRISEKLLLRMQLAFDKGKLRGDNFGGMLNITYSGNLSKHTR